MTHSKFQRETFLPVVMPIQMKVFKLLVFSCFRYWGGRNPLDTVGGFWALGENWSENKLKAKEKGIDTFEFSRLAAMHGLFANWPRDFMISAGYRFHDLIVSCIFDGRLCGQSSFILYEHPEMINCYTFQLNKTSYLRAGPEAGLTVLLYIGMFDLGNPLPSSSCILVLHNNHSQ